MRRRIEAEFIDEIVYGKKPEIALSAALGQYLGVGDGGVRIAGKGKNLGALDLKILIRADKKFGARPLAQISGDEWSEWVLVVNRDNQPSTIRRFWNPLRAFLGWCANSKRGWLPSVPSVDLPKVNSARHAQRRRVADLSPELMAFLFEHAALHLKAQLYVQWSTGARVVSVLFGSRLCDLTLSPERSTIVFHDTKNGDSVPAALHPQAALVVGDYLKERGRLNDREGSLFLTPSGLPYSRRGRAREWGSENKTAWRGMKKRAVAVRRQMASAAEGAERERLLVEAELLAQVTPHWLRHWFATHALSSGMGPAEVMAQGGWRDYRSLQRYAHDVSETRRRGIAQLPIGSGGEHAVELMHD